MSRPGILAEIIEHKRAETLSRKAARPLAAVRRVAEDAAPARPFADRVRTDRPAVIAEIKKASPSEGVIRADFDPQAIATDYASANASCLSVLTDERFFQGDDAYLVAARTACALPVLRKDFIIDEYQVYETRALGADCLLLIVAALEPAQLVDFNRLALDIGLDVLIEVHDRSELHQALALGPGIVGINNRDLRTFTTRLETTLDLLDDVPDDVSVVTESGIHTSQDVRCMFDAGVNAFLVGTAFMRAASPGPRCCAWCWARRIDRRDDLMACTGVLARNTRLGMRTGTSAHLSDGDGEGRAPQALRGPAPASRMRPVLWALKASIR